MPFVKGMTFTEEHKAKLRVANSGSRLWRIGFRHSEEAKLKIGLASRGNTYRRGVPLPQELKNRISETLKGQIPWNKELTGEGWPEARRKAQEARKGKPYVQRKLRKPYSKSGELRTRKPYVNSVGKEYSFNWREVRKKIYKRDNWTCQECGIKCTLQGKRKIQCHYIDYDVFNNEEFNLITLCASCHGRTNGSRKDWIKYFKGFKILWQA